MNFKEREIKEIVWGYKVKFKNETDDDHIFSSAPRYMPYIIIGKDNDEYYVMLTTTSPNNNTKYFCLSNNKYPEIKKHIFVRLDQIYKLKRTDITKNYLGDEEEPLKITEKDYKLLFDYIKSANALDEEDNLIFNQLYKNVNPLDVRDVVSIKEDDEFKEYSIFKQLNKEEFYGIKTNIPNRMTKAYKNMTFDYSDIRVFSKKDAILTKYTKVLNKDEIDKISERVNFYRQDLSQTSFCQKYEFGTILNDKGSDYIVLVDEDEFVYLTKPSNFNNLLTISKLPKDNIDFEVTGTLDIKTKVKLLNRLSWDIKEIWTPNLQKEVVKKLKAPGK